MSADFQDFTLDVMRELNRARAKHPNEEGVLTDAEWLAVLTEEVGECARAIQDDGDAELRAELAQVAAVVARWYASIPLGRVRPPWSTASAVANFTCGASRKGAAPCPGCAQQGECAQHHPPRTTPDDPECRRLRNEGATGPECGCSDRVCVLRVGA